MRTVVQRVLEARVSIGAEVAAAIGPGLCVLVGVADGDGEEEAVRLAERIARLRVFENDEGRFDRSVLDTGGSALVVSQFTLITDPRGRKGRRPDFSRAARPEVAEPLYDAFCRELGSHGVPVETGRFGARMVVSLANDGPVTIVLEA